MGLFWDRLKGLFKKPAQLAPSAPQIAATMEQYERNERVDHTDMVGFLGAIDEHVANGGTMIFKQSSGKDLELLKTTYVGFDPIRSNPRLHIRKMKSQQRNWKHWKKRARR